MSKEAKTDELLDLQSIRAKIVDRLRPTRAPMALGGVDVEVETRSVRDVLSYGAGEEDETPEARVKVLARAIHLPGSEEPLFDPESKEHLEMLLSMKNGGQIEKVFELLNDRGVADAQGN